MFTGIYNRYRHPVQTYGTLRSAAVHHFAFAALIAVAVLAGLYHYGWVGVQWNPATAESPVASNPAPAATVLKELDAKVNESHKELGDRQKQLEGELGKLKEVGGTKPLEVPLPQRVTSADAATLALRNAVLEAQHERDARELSELRARINVPQAAPVQWRIQVTTK